MEVLAADIGGTNARLAIVKGRHIRYKKVYACRDFNNPFEIFKRFAQEYSASLPEFGCIAVAGRVENNQVKMVNRDWVINGDELASKLGLKGLYIANDFQAAAMGVSILSEDDLLFLGGEPPLSHHPKAVIGPGTGLGEAILVPYATGYEVLPTEGGHVDFAPTDEIQIELLRFLKRHFFHVSIERILSGPGLVWIFRYLCEKEGVSPLDSLKEILDTPKGPPTISDAALNNKDEICVKSLALFCKILGQEAGNMALKCLARGGVYVAGGIAPKIHSFLKRSEFRKAFEEKGRLKDFLQKVPTYIVMNTQVGILGAGLLAEKRAKE